MATYVHERCDYGNAKIGNDQKRIQIQVGLNITILRFTNYQHLLN
jgi:hypothetical protein